MPRYVAKFTKKVLTDSGHQSSITQRAFDLDAPDRDEASRLAKGAFLRLGGNTKLVVTCRRSGFRGSGFSFVRALGNQDCLAAGVLSSGLVSMLTPLVRGQLKSSARPPGAEMGSPFARTRLAKGSVAGGRLPWLLPPRSSSDLTFTAEINIGSRSSAGISLPAHSNWLGDLLHGPSYLSRNSRDLLLQCGRRRETGRRCEV